MTDKLAWMKYAGAAILLHAAALSLFIFLKTPQTGKELRHIEVTLMREEASPAPMRLKREKPAPSRPVEPVPLTAIGERASVKQQGNPVEKQEEPRAAGPGKGPDGEVASRAPDGWSSPKGQGVAIAGVNTAEGRVSLGSGTGKGTGTGGTGTGTGAGRGGEGGPVEARFGDVDGPRFLHYEEPAYPSEAKRRGREGRVVLLVSIDEKGKLVRADVVEATNQIFAQSAMEALKRSTFAPAKRNGLPIACTAMWPVRFALQD